MKTIALCVLFLIFATYLYAAKNITICGRVFSKDNFVVKIFEPINGYYNQLSVDVNSNPIKVEKDSFFYSFKSLNDIPSFFSISIIEERTGLPIIGTVDFLLCPGDSTHLSIEPTDKDFSWMVFSGDNATGNNLFQQINFHPAEKFKDLFSLLENLPAQKEEFTKNVDKLIDKFNSQFDHLYNKKKISAAYFQSMRKTFMMSFFTVIINEFLYPDRVTSKTSKNFRDSIVENLYYRLRPDDIYIKSLE